MTYYICSVSVLLHYKIILCNFFVMMWIMCNLPFCEQPYRRILNNPFTIYKYVGIHLKYNESQEINELTGYCSSYGKSSHFGLSSGGLKFIPLFKLSKRPYLFASSNMFASSPEVNNVSFK